MIAAVLAALALGLLFGSALPRRKAAILWWAALAGSITVWLVTVLA